MRTDRCWKLSAALLLLFALRSTICNDVPEERNTDIIHDYHRKPKNQPIPTSRTSGEDTCVDRGEVELRLSRIGMLMVGANVVTSKRVVKLHLDDNRIVEVASCAFDMVPNLRLLNLSLNNISTPLMLRIGGHKELRRLIVDDNKRRDENSALEEALDCLPRLEELSLRSGGISRFAVDLNKFAPVLVRLNLSGNKIKSSAFLENAPKNLKIIDLSDNALSRIEKGFLNNTVELVVSKNKIEELCSDSCGSSSLSVRGMVHLETLNASSNAIAKIAADAFDGSSKLKILDLSANMVDNFDQILSHGLANLQELFVAKNRLTTVPNVCNLKRLEILDVAGNLIEAVSKDSFCPQSVSVGIRVVNLSGNKIKTVDYYPFKRLTALKDLDLSNNQISTFPKNLISTLVYLCRLSMRNNLIDNLGNLAGERSHYLQELHLQDNPLLFFNMSWINYSMLSKLVIYLKDNAYKDEEADPEDTDSMESSSGSFFYG